MRDTKQLPDRLSVVPIAEAMVEVRFDCDESAKVPELVVGRLAGRPEWRDFAPLRLPIADIPAPVRMQDPNLKVQPVLELKRSDGLRLVKIGANAISYHATSSYPGWVSLKPEMYSTVDFLFSQFTNFTANRIGFRYINLLSAEEHHIPNLSVLDFSISVEGEPLSTSLNLNYHINHGKEHTVLVRIATPDFVQGVQKPFIAMIDVDVFTPSPFRTARSEDAKSWIEDAHAYLKREFFSLLTPELISKLGGQQ